MCDGIYIIGYELGKLAFVQLHIVTGDEGDIAGDAVGERKVGSNPWEFFLGVGIEGYVWKAFEGGSERLLKTEEEVEGEGAVFVPKVAVEIHAPVIADEVAAGIEAEDGAHQLLECGGQGIEDQLFFAGEDAPVFVFIDYAGTQVPFQVTGVGAESIDGVGTHLPALGDTSFFVPLEEDEGFGEDSSFFQDFTILFVIIAEEAGAEHGVEAVGRGDLVGAVVVQAGEPFEGMFFGSEEEGGVGECEEFCLSVVIEKEAKSAYTVEAVFLEGVENRFFEKCYLSVEWLLQKEEHKQ